MKAWPALAALVALVLVGAAAPLAATTYYVRPDGGSPAQCTGLADAPYPGAGSSQPCAWNHPFQALPPGGTARLSAGDTLIIGSGSYRMGIGAPGSGGCDPDAPWDCILLPPPSGASAAAPTRLLGAGWDAGCPAPPELWGSGRPWEVLDLGGRDHLEIACLEITDHSPCVEFHADPTVACQRDSPPYGDWASAGIFAHDSRDVRLADLDVHGLASQGVLAGGLTDWAVERVRVVTNGWAGWDGDVGAGSGNAGDLVFRQVEVGWNGCGETWPGGEPHGCWAQQSGGYGDGFAAGSSAGHWVLEDLHVHHNTSDGVDLLYLTAGSELEIRRLVAEGNAGNQLKLSGPATVENSLLVGNCGFFDDPQWPWMVGGDHCRAFGNTIDVDLRPGTVVTMVNLTVAGEGDCLLGAGCEGGGCTGGEQLWVRNTLFAGATDFLQPFENTCLYYTELLPDPGDLDWNLIWNVKDDPCPGAHSVCGQAPLVADASVDHFDGRLQPASPAIGTADPTVAPATDVLGHPRDADPDIGAYEASLFADGFESGDTSAWSVTVSGRLQPRRGRWPHSPHRTPPFSSAAGMV